MTNKRTVNCKKLTKNLPGLEKPPFPGELGQKIYENISEEAWKSWSDDMQIKVINEYRLNMAEKDDYNMLIQQMKIFLNLESGDTAEVENPDRGQSE